MTIRKTISILSIAGVAGALAFLSADSRAQDEAKIDFEKQIWPFVKASCVKCHKPPYEDERGRTRKPKGGLVITNKEGLMKGGELTEEEDIYPIVAGKPEESSFLQRTLLPLDHDDHMPPETKADQWTDEQKKLFEAWVKQGADFGEWTDDPEAAKPPKPE